MAPEEVIRSSGCHMGSMVGISMCLVVVDTAARISRGFGQEATLTLSLGEGIMLSSISQALHISRSLALVVMGVVREGGRSL